MQPTYLRELARSEKNRKRNSRRKKRNQSTLKKIGMITLITLAIIVVGTIVGLYCMRYSGMKQLKENTIGSVADMQMQEKSYELLKDASEADGDGKSGADVSKQYEQKEGRVFFRGKAYDFNTDIMTFLCMGIDQRSEYVKEYTEGFDAGSADAIFLLVLNPHTQKMQIVAIDRNTMADVDIYDYYGNYEDTIQTQICVQHGFGDGTVKSAWYMEKAVSNLLYGLPINGYAAINMSAVPIINDAVGGVDVKVTKDFKYKKFSLKEGQEIHLEGEDAYFYLCRRDTNVFGSAADRLERQKQYLTSFIKTAKAEFKKNPTLPLNLFNSLKRYMTTDINAEKVTYLASMASGFDFGEMDIRKIPGETVMGEEYEEFYVDEVGMFTLLLDVFYEEVTE